MKKLGIFLKVDFDALFSGANVLVMKSEVLKDSDGNAKGAKYTLLFWEDAPDLLAKYGDAEVSNSGETFTVKVLGKAPKSVAKPTKLARLVNPTGKVWGDFRNQLSVTADDVELVAPKEARS